MIVDSWLRVHKTEGRWEELQDRYKARNPEFVQALQRGASTVGLREWDNLWEVHGDYLCLPRGAATQYMDNHHYSLLDHTSLGYAVDFKSRINPRDNQHTFINGLQSAIEGTYGALGQAEPGFGKTVCVLDIIAKLGRTAVILVHKSFLINQWMERIKEYYDIKESEIGIIQQDRCEYKGKKISLAMAQSLLAREGRYPEEMYSYFGTVAVDEVHRFAAPTFRQTIVQFPGRYRIGVTATPKRKDGLQNVFVDHIGTIAVVGEKRKVKPIIKQVAAEMVVASERPFRSRYSDRPDLTKVITYITKAETFNRQIVKLAIKAVEAGRKVIVFSDRRGHLDTLDVMFGVELKKEGKRYTVGFYVGGMNEEQLAISATRNIILATYAMAQEGLDIPELDTCFLTTPKGDIEQVVGRITRENDDKKQPMVVDFVHPISICKGMAANRFRQYKKLGWMN